MAIFEAKSKQDILIDHLDDIIWRIDDISQMLREKGYDNKSVYGCDEWSTPVVNLKTAKKVVNNLKDKILADFIPDWNQEEYIKATLKEYIYTLKTANTLLKKLRDTKTTWVGDEENQLRVDIDKYLYGDYEIGG